MSIDAAQLKEFVIKPVLVGIGNYSEGFCDLILGTALTESGLKYLRQFPEGPAKGIYQMEDATHDDIWNNYLQFRPSLRKVASGFAFANISAEQMTGNLYYASCMCALHYLRYVKNFPPANDALQMSAIWKKFYNTPSGKGKQEDFILRTKSIF